MFDFECFRMRWESCFNLDESGRRLLLESMSDRELNHFAEIEIGDLMTREEVINEHIEFFAWEMGEIDREDDEIPF